MGAFAGDHEPALALFAQKNGLALIFELLLQTKTKLALGGTLILEADPEQHPAIQKEAIKNGLVHVETIEYGIAFEKLK
jgi:methylase of polypeptide subunit release factors